MKYFTLSFFLSIYTPALLAQHIISGTIKSEKNTVVPDAAITITKKGNIQIEAYSMSNNKGQYQIKIVSNEDSLMLEVNAMGFLPIAKWTINATQVIDFTLPEHTTILPTVILKQKPVSENGDTINYSVKAFTGKEDRVIADVISKLPGIAIDGKSGQISFNGKPISHYYIDGLDLLEGRYNIANKNIPADLVERVQVLTNHQPVKLFDSLTISTDPAINIQLKPNGRNRLIGKASVGIGIEPILYDNHLTGLLFNKGFQSISAYKNNNTGAILSNEIANNVTETKVGERVEKNNKEEILATIKSSYPEINTYRYLFNNSHLAYFNSLKILSNTGQLKFNLNYLNSNISLNSESQTTYFLPAGKVRFFERISNFINTNSFAGNAFYTLNKKNLYLKNSSSMSTEFVNENGGVVNTSFITQSLKNPFFKFGNEMILNLPVNRKILSLSSTINYSTMPQRLNVSPGQFGDVLNNGLDYQESIQHLTIDQFNMDNNLSVAHKKGMLLHQFRIGGAYVFKNLHSEAEKLFNNTRIQLNDSFKNDVTWRNLKAYATSTTSFINGKRQLMITLPLEFNLLYKTNKLNPSNPSNASNNKFFFNPVVSIDLPISSNLNLSALYYYKKSIGDVTQTTQGFILNNYRSISRNDSLLPVEKQQAVSISVNYKNSLHALFANFSTSYFDSRKNIIIGQRFDDFFVTSTGIYLANGQQGFVFKGAISKYFLESKINIAFNASGSLFRTDVLQQGEIAKSFSKLYDLDFKFQTATFSWITIESTLKLNNFKNKLISSGSRTIPSANNYRLNETLKFHFFLSNRITLFFNNEFYKVWNDKVANQHYFFSDIGITRKFRKAEIEIFWANITNNKNFQTIVNLENVQKINLYQIRPSSLMIKVNVDL